MKPMHDMAPVTNSNCANCGAPLYGEYCYACGQPVKGLVRHLSGILGDVFDTVLNIDSRVLRTLPALFLRPGHLSREYFAGRRVRYVTPFRLMFFLCLGAFFVMQLAFDSATSTWHLGNDKAGFSHARTTAEVIAREKQVLDSIDKAGANTDMPQLARSSLDQARKEVRRDAAQRLAELNATGKAALPASAASVAAPAIPATAPSSPDSAGSGYPTDHSKDYALFGVDAWSPARNQVHVSWLPGIANAWLNRAAQRMHDNVVQLKDGTPENRRAALQRMFAGMFSVLPQTMFVLLPLFAVILKVFYVFKRRLYMEHLIVALHSHAFIFLWLLVLLGLGALKGWLLPHAGWLGVPFGLLTAALWIWVFLYLLLMQKRVYAQGWFFTTLKYCCVGICYTVLLSISLALAFALSLARA